MSAHDDALDTAITEYAKAEEWSGVIAGWVVLAAVIDHDGEDSTSGVITIYPGGTLPWHTALGIVEAGRVRMHQAFGSGDQISP